MASMPHWFRAKPWKMLISNSQLFIHQCPGPDLSDTSSNTLTGEAIYNGSYATKLQLGMTYSQAAKNDNIYLANLATAVCCRSDWKVLLPRPDETPARSWTRRAALSLTAPLRSVLPDLVELNPPNHVPKPAHFSKKPPNDVFHRKNNNF